MNTIQRTILGCLLAATVALAVPAFTGCQNLRDFSEEHPVATNLTRAGLLIGLNAAAENYAPVQENRAAIAALIDTALTDADSPEAAANILEKQSLDILDDPAVRDALIAAWDAELANRTEGQFASASGDGYGGVAYATAFRAALE